MSDMVDMCNMFLPQNTPAMSARTLILDIVGTGDLPAYCVRHLLRAGEAFGMEATNIRSALTRLRQEGRISGIGRGAYRISDTARPMQDHLRNWRRVLTRRIEWHHGWMLVVTGPAERASRTQWRHTLRALTLSGFVESDSNVWLRPANLSGGVAEMRENLTMLGATPQLLLVEAQGLDAARAAALPQRWPYEELAGEYVQLSQQLAESATRLEAMPLPDAAAESLVLGRQAIAAILRDPLLPETLYSTAALGELIATMDAYDAIGTTLWRSFLAD